MYVATRYYRPGVGWSEPLPVLDSPSTLVLAFCDDGIAPDDCVWAELAKSFETSVILGCSTSGNVLGASLCNGSLAVTIARFDRTRLAHASSALRDHEDSRAVGADIGAQLRHPDLRGVFVLSDGLHVNGSDLVAGLTATVGGDVVVTGGLAGDGDRFGDTWVFERGSCVPGRVVAVGLYGDAVHIGAGSCGGWTGFGPERSVTSARGNVLYELDGEPALGLYRRYLGELSSELPASALLVPLSVRPSSTAEPIVRTILAVDEEAQSMTFAGDMPVGWVAQLMRSSAHRLIEGAASAARLSRNGFDENRPSLSVAVSCVGRRLVLRERIDEELEASIDALSPMSSLVGFYSYGEIAPSSSGATELHNQTMTITTITEDD